MHVGLHVGDGGQLIGRLLVGERFFHLLLPGRVGAEAESLDGCATRVHVHQIEGELLGGLARTRHGTRPIRCVQPRETGISALGAHIARHAVELLDRHVELVALGVFQQQVVAHGPVNVLLHEPREMRHAMCRMHDVIARLVGTLVCPLGGSSLRVGYADQGELRLGNDHAERDLDVHDVHDALLQAALADLLRHGFVGNAQRRLT